MTIKRRFGMKMKKVIVPILAVAMMAAVFAACGGRTREQPSESQAPQETSAAQPTDALKEIKTLTVYVGDTNMKPVDVMQTPVGKKIEELAGVKLQIEYIVGSDEKTKAGVMIAAGEYPDIICGHNEVSQFIDAGALLPLDDYIDRFGENIKRAYGKLTCLDTRWTTRYILFLLSENRPT